MPMLPDETWQYLSDQYLEKHYQDPRVNPNTTVEQKGLRKKITPNDILLHFLVSAMLS